MSFVINMLSAGAAYSADKAQAKAQRAWQQYSNKMTELSATVSQNAITTNTLLASDRLAMAAMQLKKQTLGTTAEAVTNAAAAGVKGNSVSRQIRQILSNASQRDFDRQEEFRATMLGFDQQRINVSMSAAMQKDYSYIPKPKFGSYFLGAVSKSEDQIMGGLGGMGGTGGTSTYNPRLGSQGASSSTFSSGETIHWRKT